MRGRCFASLAEFAAAFLFFAASPGPDNVTIVARTIAQGAAEGGLRCGSGLAVADGVMLAMIILDVEVVVVGGHVALASHARHALRNPLIVRRANRAAGAVMIGADAAVVATR